LQLYPKHKSDYYIWLKTWLVAESDKPFVL
jgi:hypothetical protein